MILVAHAWEDLIVCTGLADKPCNWNSLVLLTKNLMTNLILISTILVTIGFIYIGFTFLTSGGNEGARTKAKDMFKKLVFGFIFVLAAWLIVYTISNVLLDNPGAYSIIK